MLATQSQRPWPFAKLAEVCDLFTGGTPPTTQEDYWDGDIPWVSPKDMKFRRIDGAQKRVSWEAVADKKTRIVEEGAILCVTRSGILARAFPIAVTACPVAFNQDIRALVPKRERIISHFLQFVLEWLEPVVLAQGVKKGATVHSVRSGFLENLRIPCPSIPEQCRISVLLSGQMASVDQLRAALNEQVEAAKQLRRRGVREVFRDDRVRNSQRRPLGELCTLLNGDAFRESDWSHSGHPIIRIQNLNDPTKPFNYWAGSLDNRVVVRNGDVVLAWSGTPGSSFGAHRWSGDEGVLNQHIFRVDLDTDMLDPDWAVIAINEQLDEMIGRAQGAVGLRHITKPETLALQLAVPELPIQRELAILYNHRLCISQKTLDELNVQLSLVNRLGHSLLDETFSQGADPRG